MKIFICDECGKMTDCLHSVQIKKEFSNEDLYPEYYIEDGLKFCTNCIEKYFHKFKKGLKRLTREDIIKEKL